MKEALITAQGALHELVRLRKLQRDANNLQCSGSFENARKQRDWLNEVAEKTPLAYESARDALQVVNDALRLAEEQQAESNDARRQYRVQVRRHGSGPFDAINEPFIVPTPRPYVVDMATYRDPAAKVAAQASLLEAVEHLNECLRLLGIPLTEAAAEDYTLNIITRNKLIDRAHATGNMAASDKISERKW